MGLLPMKYSAYINIYIYICNIDIGWLFCCCLKKWQSPLKNKLITGFDLVIKQFSNRGGAMVTQTCRRTETWPNVGQLNGAKTICDLLLSQKRVSNKKMVTVVIPNVLFPLLIPILCLTGSISIPIFLLRSIKTYSFKPQIA